MPIPPSIPQHFQDTDELCGAASVMMVLDGLQNFEASQKAIFDGVKELPPESPIEAGAWKLRAHQLASSLNSRLGWPAAEGLLSVRKYERLGRRESAEVLKAADASLALGFPAILLTGRDHWVVVRRAAEDGAGYWLRNPLPPRLSDSPHLPGGKCKCATAPNTDWWVPARHLKSIMANVSVDFGGYSAGHFLAVVAVVRAKGTEGVARFLRRSAERVRSWFPSPAAPAPAAGAPVKLSPADARGRIKASGFTPESGAAAWREAISKNDVMLHEATGSDGRNLTLAELPADDSRHVLAWFDEAGALLTVGLASDWPGLGSPQAAEEKLRKSTESVTLLPGEKSVRLAEANFRVEPEIVAPWTGNHALPLWPAYRLKFKSPEELVPRSAFALPEGRVLFTSDEPGSTR